MINLVHKQRPVHLGLIKDEARKKASVDLRANNELNYDYFTKRTHFKHDKQEQNH